MDWNKIVIDTAVHLQGSCDILDAHLMEVYGLSTEDIPLPFLEHFDSLVGLCETCSWWFDIDELNDNTMCEGCVTDE